MTTTRTGGRGGGAARRASQDAGSGLAARVKSLEAGQERHAKLLSAFGPEGAEDQDAAAYLEFDENADDFIQPRELRDGLAAIGVALTTADLYSLMGRYDLDGDGRLNRDEFSGLMRAARRADDPLFQTPRTGR